MAKKGTAKHHSVQHELIVAEAYDGKRSNSSGAAVTDEGDVRVISDNTLFECKAKLGELLGGKPVRSTVLSQFEKVWDEATSIGKEAALALRFYAPESPMSDKDGYVDLVVRELDDDAHRSFLLETQRCR